MNAKNHRAPWAVALVAMFAMSALPTSGADESATTLYTFHTGAPGEPTWTILKLDVTHPGVHPIVTYFSSEVHCPMYWGSYFMIGGPNDAHPYNSLAFGWSSGRWGYDATVSTPLFVDHTARMTNDGADGPCSWPDPTVIYGELPVGTVYMLQFQAGLPFTSTSTFSVDGPGVTIVGTSSGSTFYHNESNMANGWGLSAFGPPFCGAPWELPNCSTLHTNQGGHVGAVVEVERSALLHFKHHPFVLFRDVGDETWSNATVTDPNGNEYFAEPKPGAGKLGELNENSEGILIQNMTMPSGYWHFTIHKSANLGAGAHPGWFFTGADLRFPEES